MKNKNYIFMKVDTHALTRCLLPVGLLLLWTNTVSAGNDFLSANESGWTATLPEIAVGSDTKTLRQWFAQDSTDDLLRRRRSVRRPGKEEASETTEPGEVPEAAPVAQPQTTVPLGATPPGSDTSTEEARQEQTPPTPPPAVAQEPAPVPGETEKATTAPPVVEKLPTPKSDITVEETQPSSPAVETQVIQGTPKPAGEESTETQVREPQPSTEVKETQAKPRPTSPPASKPTIYSRKNGLPAANLDSVDTPVAVPDRWRIVGALGYNENWLDPYNGYNPLKADVPVFGKDWFFNLGIISDTVIEPRYIPVPVGIATTAGANALDTIGDGKQFVFSQNIILEAVLYQGDTVFRPPDYEFRFIPVINYNQVQLEERGLVNVDPTAKDDRGTARSDSFVGVQALFVDKHLRNVSDRYDFDSLRVGIQPFSSDFRGFLFQDQPFGVRLFGTRDNNIFQYNLGWFRRLEKDTNSGLNSLEQDFRDDDVFVANLYWNDYPRLGFNSQATIIHNVNREGDDTYYDKNGFIVRPSSLFEERGRDYDVTYLGYNADGHLGRLNLTGSFYYALGEETSTRAAGVDNEIQAFFGAAEASVDFDWIRLRFSGVYGSGDSDPFDTKSEGFDAIFENPQIAGADTSYYIRQPVPLIGGGGVTLSGRNGILNSLRSSKEQGQSNFVNPGITLLGVGADFDILPELRASLNVNQLWFNETGVLEVLRQQGSIDSEIGTDLSLSLIYRPWMSQNIVMRLSGAALLPGQGFSDLYGDEETNYSILANIILTY